MKNECRSHTVSDRKESGRPHDTGKDPRAQQRDTRTPDNHIILPEVISKEPLGPAVRQGDDQWFNLIKWTLYSLINAEELGVKSATVDDAVKSSNPNIRRLVGTEGEFGDQLGL